MVTTFSEDTVISNVPTEIVPVDQMPPDVDYKDGLDAGDLERLVNLVSRTKLLTRRVVSDTVEIGLNLIQAKEILHADGKFHAWLVAEFGWTIRTAQNMMQTARIFPHAIERTWDIDLRAFYLLASGSTPEHVRDWYVGMAEAGIPITYKDVRGRTSVDGKSICNVCGEIFPHPNPLYHCPECNVHSDADDMENGTCPNCGADTGSSMYPSMEDIEPLIIDTTDSESKPEQPPEEKAARLLANALWITNLEPELVVDYLDDIQRETVTDLIKWMASFGKALKAAR